MRFKVEELGLEPMPTWDAGVSDRGLAYFAMVPAQDTLLYICCYIFITPSEILFSKQRN